MAAVATVVLAASAVERFYRYFIRLEFLDLNIFQMEGGMLATGEADLQVCGALVGVGTAKARQGGLGESIVWFN